MRVRPTAVLGGLVLAAGFALLVSPELAAALGLEFEFVTLLGVLALVQALRFVQNRRKVDLREAVTGDPELRYGAPAPGDTVDVTLAKSQGWSRYDRTAKGRLRNRVAEAATDALVATEGISPEAARDRLADGTWTDDDVAAWFLSDGVVLSPATRARLLFGRRSQFVAGFDRAVDAVAALSGVDGER